VGVAIKCAKINNFEEMNTAFLGQKEERPQTQFVFLKR